MKIVVHVDSGETWPRRVEAALEILRLRGGGKLMGLFGQMATALPSYSYHGDRSTIDKAAEPAKARFDEMVTAVPSVDATWHTIHSVNQGFITSELTSNAHYADLTVLGQPDPRATAERVPADLPEQVVLNCGRPVLMIPFAGTFDFSFQRVLIAFNEAREATRAMNDSLPLIKGADARVIIVRHGPDKGDLRDWRWDALVNHLSDHGVSATVEAPTIANIGVADFLLSQAADTSAQLLVMGAYGKLGLPRMLRGSVTRDVLRQMTLPVLLGH